MAVDRSILWQELDGANLMAVRGVAWEAGIIPLLLWWSDI
jgi:hypothetical protein